MFHRRPAFSSAPPPVMPAAELKAPATAPYDSMFHDEVWHGKRRWIVTGCAPDGKLRLMRRGKEGTLRCEIRPTEALGIVERGGAE